MLHVIIIRLKIPPIEDILNSLEIILKNNDLTFNSKAYRETTGAPMGDAALADFVNIRMLEISEHILTKYSTKDKVAFCNWYTYNELVLYNANKKRTPKTFHNAKQGPKIS